MYEDENIPYFNEDSAHVTFCIDGIGILTVNLNNINLDNSFDKDDLDVIIIIIIIIRRLA